MKHCAVLVLLLMCAVGVSRAAGGVWHNGGSLDTLCCVKGGAAYKDYNGFDGGTVADDTIGWGAVGQAATRALWLFDLASVSEDLGYTIDRSHVTEIHVTLWSDIVSVNTLNCRLDIGNHTTSSWEDKGGVADDHAEQSFSITSTVLDYVNETDRGEWLSGGGCTSCSYQPGDIVVSVDVPSAGKVVVDSLAVVVIAQGYTPPVPPRVVSFSPKGNAVSTTNPGITVIFNKAMRTDIIDYFEIRQNGNSLAHTVTLSADSQTATVGLSGTLEREWPVTVAVDDVCRDVYGQYLDGNEDGTGSGSEADEFRWVFFPEANEPPVVSNVTMSGAAGTMDAIVGYDIADPDDATVNVMLHISTDTGKTYDHFFSAAGGSVSGDIGVGVSVGTGKHIDWTFSSDLHQSDHGSRFVAMVEADDGFTPPSGETNPRALEYGTQRLAAVSFDDKLWIIGGLRWGSGCNCAFETNAVGFTRDGVTVHEVSPTDGVIFDGRQSHAAVVYKNQIVVAGGRDRSNDELNDVWVSGDGFTWMQAAANAAWSPRRGLRMLAARDTLWLFGGRTSDNTDQSEVWVSTDAVDWHLKAATPNIPMPGGFRVAYHGGQFYLMAEGLWRSDDGASWSAVATNDTTFYMRTYHSFISDGEKLYAASGFVDSHRMRDVWSSTDGENWVRTVEQWPFCSRTGQATAVYAGKVWIVGGYGCADSNGNYLRDIFYIAE